MCSAATTSSIVVVSDCTRSVWPHIIDEVATQRLLILEGKVKGKAHPIRGHEGP